MNLIRDLVFGLYILIRTGKSQRWVQEVFYRIVHLQLEEWVEFDKFGLIAYGAYAEVKLGDVQYAFNDCDTGMVVHVNVPDVKKNMPYTEVYRRKKLLKEVKWIQILKELNRALISNNAYQLRARELETPPSSASTQ